MRCARCTSDEHPTDRCPRNAPLQRGKGARGPRVSHARRREGFADDVGDVLGDVLYWVLFLWLFD